MARQMAIIKVAPELIEMIIEVGTGKCVPVSPLKDVKIIDVRYISKTSLIEIKITSPDLPEIDIGAMLPILDYKFRRIEEETPDFDIEVLEPMELTEGCNLPK